jgi:hypothetical protein
VLLSEGGHDAREPRDELIERTCHARRPDVGHR